MKGSLLYIILVATAAYITASLAAVLKMVRIAMPNCVNRIVYDNNFVKLIDSLLCTICFLPIKKPYLAS